MTTTPTTPAAVSVKARKGDLVLVERTESTSYVSGQGRRAERTTFHYGVVSSASRDGVAKTWSQVGYGDALLSTANVPLRRGDRLRVMPKADIDVAAVLKAAKAHHWPNHPGQPMPFDSLAEAIDAARPHKVARVA